MKVLLVAVNSKFVHSSLAVWYLHAKVRKSLKNVECSVLECTINENENNILKKIIDTDADIIGFSTYIWNVKTVLSIAERCKQEMGASIVLGGPEVSYNAQSILRDNWFVDYVISGEGETPFFLICSNEDREKIPGLCYRKQGGFVVKEPNVEFGEPISPYSKEYFESLNGRIAYIETSRGCPYRCAFCLSGRCGGVRFFDLENAKKNILLLANSGTQTIKFIDRTFNADRKRAREIFSFIIRNFEKNIPKGVCFHFEIEGELLDEETIKLLSLAPKGLFQFEIGLQSCNSKTLEYINRKTDLDKLFANIKSIINLGNIHTHVDLIAGLPFEDIKSLEKSFNLAYSLKPHMLQLGFLKLLHGADMREQKDKYKCSFIDTPPYEIQNNEWLSSEEITELHAFEDVFEKLYNSNRFSLTCEYLCQTFPNQFEMFMELASYLNDRKLKSLDEFSEGVFNFFVKKQEIDSKALRDYMAIDRLATNRMGALPEFLRAHSPYTKKTLNYLERDEKTKRPKNIKRAATPLLTENLLAYVDYTESDYLTNRFLVKFTKIITN